MLSARTKAISLPALILIGVTAGTAQQSGARFLLLRPTAVSTGMGGTGVAYQEGASAAYFNPALLAFVNGTSFSASFVKPVPPFGNIAHSHISASHSLESLGTVGFVANLYWKGRHARTASSGPEIIGSEHLQDWQLKMSFSRKISENTVIGAGVGILRINVTDIGTEQEVGIGRSTTATFDAGVSLRRLLPGATLVEQEESPSEFPANIADTTVHEGLSVGLSILQIGQRIVFIDEEQGDDLPTTLLAGFAYSPVRTGAIGFLFSIDIEKNLNEASTIDNLRWGGELRVLRILSLRGGYVHDVYGQKNSFGTWGAGIHLRFFQFNISRYSQSLFPAWHFDGTFALEF